MKKLRAKSAAALVACGMLTIGALSACGGGGTTPASGQSAESGESVSSAPLNIEVVSKGFQVDFWKMVNAGASAAGEEYGANVNFVGPASEANISEQIEQLNNAINKRPSAIAFAPLDQDASMDLISQAASLDIPLITFDANIEADTGGAVKAFVATDNVAAGAEAADRMHEVIKDQIDKASEPVRIGVMAQDTTSESVAQRTAGFIDRMVELVGSDKTSVIGHDMYAAPVDGAKVILDVGIPAETTDAAGNTTAQTLLNKADLIGIYGSNEFSAKAIINANETLQRLGPDGVVAIGFDSGALQVQAVRDGVFLGSITQDPMQIGFLTVETAIKAAKGEEVHDISVPFHFYDANNVDDPEIASCLYE